MEELVTSWVQFTEDEHEDEADFLQVMEESQRKKEEIIDREWHAVWMLKMSQKQKGMNYFQFHALRDTLRVEGDKMI